MKKLTFILAVVATALLGACCGKYKYETVKGDPLKTRIYTLDNGLKVYMSVNKEEPRVQTYIAVRVGGKNDPAETTGLAHYFEHLMFKGTQSFGTKDYAAEKPLLDEIEGLFEVYRKTTDEAERTKLYARIDSISYIASGYSIPNEYDKLMAAIGASNTNAYTSTDQTVYVENIPSNQMENWLKIEADRFKKPVLRGFHTELETIYEEKNMSLTRDEMKVVDQMLAALFPNHPYGTQTVIGTQEHLKNPSITNVKNYHAEWYVPNNMAICLSGDLDFDATIALIDKYFGDMQPNPELAQPAFEPQPEITAPITREVLGLDAESVSLAWSVGSTIQDNDMMTVVSNILYNGTAGLVDIDLNQGQQVLTAEGWYWPMADYGVLCLDGKPKAGQTLDEVKTLILGEVAKLRNGEFDETMLQAVIDNYKLETMSYLDSNNGRAHTYVYSFINGVQWKDAVEQIDRISAITKDQVVAYVNEHFTDNNVAVIYKREGKDPNELKMSKPALTPIQTNRDSASAFLTEMQAAAAAVTPIEPVFVDYNKDMGKLKAKSDIEVLYKKNETTDVFQLVYLYEVGRNNDPTIGYAGDYLNYLGTADMTAAERAREFYNIACSFQIGTSEERTYLIINGLAENMPRAMELAEKMMNGAVADENVLAALKANWLKERADAKLNQQRNFSALMRYVTRGPEFIAANVLTNDALMALDSESLLAKVRALSGQQHRILYYGPAAQNELLSTIEASHNVAAKLEPVAQKVSYPYVETPSSSVVLAEYDAAQIYFMQHSNLVERYDPAIAPELNLYNVYFGGGMSSIVFQEMREARGLAYSAWAGMESPWNTEIPYTFMAYIATQNDKLADATGAFETIINEMPESEAAFNIAKESIISNLRTERIIKSSVLWNYIELQDLGLDTDPRRAIYEQVPALTLADVKAFQEKWIKGRPCVYAILGRSSELNMEYLNNLGPVKNVTREDIFGY